MKPTPPVEERLTEDEQRKRVEDMILRNCARIRRERAARAKALRVLAVKRKKTPKLLARCKTCGAFKFLVHAAKTGRVIP